MTENVTEQQAIKPGERREPILGVTDNADHSAAGSDAQVPQEEQPHQQRLHMLLYLAPYSEVLLVTGSAGSGKTTLLNHFVSQAHATWRVCQVNVHPLMDASEVLRLIYAGFGLSGPSAGQVDPVEVLIDQLRIMKSSGQHPIVAIDDAHELAEAALLLLARLLAARENQQSLLSIVLFCQPHIETMLAAPSLQSLRQHITHTFGIPSLAAPVAGKRVPVSAAGGRSIKPLWIAGGLVAVIAVVLAVKDHVNALLNSKPAVPLTTAAPPSASLKAAAPVPPRPAPLTEAPAQSQPATSEIVKLPEPALPAPLVNTPASVSALEKPAQLPTRPVAPSAAIQPTRSVKGEGWLLAQNPSHYTLQLMAMQKKAPLLIFAAQQAPHNGEIAHFRARRGNDLWHVLVYGIYPGRAQAERAAKATPALAGLKPWVRRLSGVQDDIKKAQP